MINAETFINHRWERTGVDVEKITHQRRNATRLQTTIHVNDVKTGNTFRLKANEAYELRDQLDVILAEMKAEYEERKAIREAKEAKHHLDATLRHPYNLDGAVLH